MTELTIFNGPKCSVEELERNIVQYIRDAYSNALTREDAMKVLSGRSPSEFRVRVVVEKLTEDALGGPPNPPSDPYTKEAEKMLLPPGKKWDDIAGYSGGGVMPYTWREVFSLTPDDPTLGTIAYGEAVRELCAKVVEGGRFLHDHSPQAEWAKQCAAAVRRAALPDPSPATAGGEGAKHAPGPYRVADNSIISDKYCIAVIEDDGDYAAPAEERKANAALLASAPALYDALSELVDLMEDVRNGSYVPDSFTTQAARAALSPATVAAPGEGKGKQP